MAYEWERDEWWNAVRHTTTHTACQPGHHHTAATTSGGGSCTNCTETIDKDEL